MEKGRGPQVEKSGIGEPSVRVRLVQWLRGGAVADPENRFISVITDVLVS